MTSFGGDLEVDGNITARQATQAGQTVVLGEDMRIPTSFYEGGGVQKVTYSTGPDFINALKSIDGIFFYSGGWDEMEVKVVMLSEASLRSKGEIPVSGFIFNNETGNWYAVYMVKVASKFQLTLYNGTHPSCSFSDLTGSGTMGAFLF